MIYTLTFNPAIDYIINVDSYEEGTLNRSYGEKLHIGGKGINVSAVLKALDKESVALGFTAGFTGEVIQNTLNENNITSNFINLPDGFSRINVKMKSSNETEINGRGPKISQENMDILYGKLDLLKNGDILILAGSLPSSLPPTAYGDILERLKYKNITLIIDTTGELLSQLLKYKPFLIKPNQDEINEFFRKKLETEQEIIDAAKNLQERGAQNVLVSLGKKGAIMLTEDNRILKMPVPDGKAVNTTGSGDSMVAGFLAGYLDTNNLEAAFRSGIAAGCANAFSQKLPTKEEILTIYNRILEEPLE